jgi:hypothetical protein
MNKKIRDQLRKESNNRANPNKNKCALAVARTLGVDNEVRYLHTMTDLKRAISKQYSLRSVKSMVKSDTVGGARKNLDGRAFAYVVMVDEHVLLLSRIGRTVVDTSPRRRDRRKIKGIWGVYDKA